MLNKVELIGHLGQDPEVRHLADGTAVASLSLATNRRWKDKASGEKKEATEWHRVVLWGKVAEVASEYLSKGGLIQVEGRLQTRKWEDKDGHERYTTEVIGEKMLMLGGLGGGNGGGTGKKGRPPEPPPLETPPDGGLPFDDDIPF